MRSHLLTRSAAVGLAVAALAASAAAAQHQDLRSPDTREAAALAPTATVQRMDLRMPDTRDHAAGRWSSSEPEVVLKRPQSAHTADDGIAWSDAGIGAGVLLALIAIAMGGTAALVHRRHGTHRRGLS